jgi:hypothetical protein
VSRARGGGGARTVSQLGDRHLVFVVLQHLTSPMPQSARTRTFLRQRTRGIVPVKALRYTSNSNTLSQLLTVVGIVPVHRLEWNATDVTFFHCPILAGIVPVRRLPYK